MTTEGATVREQVRRRRGKGRPTAASRRLLAEYHDKMRVELQDTLAEIRPSEWHRKQGKVRPELAERAKLWDLAIKLAKELGSEIDVAPPAEEPTPLRPAGTAADFG